MDDQPDTAAAGFGLSRLLRDAFGQRDDAVSTMLQDLLHAARLQLDMEVAFISRFDSDRRTFRCVEQELDTDLISVGHSDPLEETYCKHVVEGRLPELIHNAREVPAANALACTEELNIGAHVSTPIRLPDGSVYGTICTFSFRANHTLNERDRALMHVFADIAGRLIRQEIDADHAHALRRERLEWLLDSGRLTMAWQPVVELASGRIPLVEALARFPDHEEQGPARWFEDAASVGRAPALEGHAIAKGIEILAHLPHATRVACNVSADALTDGSIAEWLQNIDLQRIVLEITEHDVVDDYATLHGVLAPLRARGLQLAVDDAGAGYASFRHIVQLQPDLIKLDMTLTRDIDSDLARRSLASSLVRFAREIDARLVAEGVETAAELDALAQLGVDYAQGYHLHRPLSWQDVIEIVGRHGRSD